MTRRLLLSALTALLALAPMAVAAQSAPDAGAAPRTEAQRAQRYREFYLESVRQRQLENYAEQAELLRAALALRPDAPEALHDLGWLLVSAAETSDTLMRQRGEQMLERAVSLAPTNVYFAEYYALYLASRGDFERALPYCQRAVSLAPTTQRLLVLANVQQRLADYTAAIATFDRIEQREGASEEISLAKYKLLTMRGDFQAADAAIETLCREHPGEPAFRVLQADLYLENGRYEQARGVLDSVLSANPDFMPAQLSLMDYYAALGQDSLRFALCQQLALNANYSSQQRADAIRHYVGDNPDECRHPWRVMDLFERAAALPQDGPELAEVWVGFADIVTDSIGLMEPALARLYELDPTNDQANQLLLHIYAERDDYERIATIVRRRQVRPAMPLFYYYTGSIALIQTGREAEAIALVDEVLDGPNGAYMSDAMRSLFLATKGDVLHQMGRNDEAYAAYDRAIELDAENYLCLNNYAYFLSLDGKRLDQAERMSRTVVEANPENATYLDTHAWVLYCQKRYEEARTYIDETLRHAEPSAESASLYDHAGDIYYRCGQREQARAYWQQALELTDEADEHAAIERKLRRGRP